MRHRMSTGTLATAAMLACAAALSLPAALVAQSGGGSIRGTVTNAKDKKPIEGARVSIDVPRRVAITNHNGKYTLGDVPAGKYEVVFTALGEKPLRKNIDIAAGTDATLDGELEEGPIMLSSVITSATKTPTEATRVATTVNVLTPQDIETSPARESQDLLREIPGVELPRTSSLVGGSSTIVSIRGVDEGRTVVTYDGVPINDAWGEWIDWGKVPKATLDHVEVVEGGTSNLYGNGAMGGAISFFSRPIVPGDVHVQLDGGSRDARHAFASVGFPLADNLSGMVTGDYQYGGGYRLIAPANAGPVDRPSTVLSRNGLARFEYAPSSNFSAYATGHLFSDFRDLGSAIGQTNRDAKSGDFGLDWGSASAGRLTVRAWDSDQNEDQFTSSITTANNVPRSKETPTAWLHIPSHDWGTGVQWSKANVLGFQSITAGGDYREMAGWTGEIDYASSGARTTYLFSGGDQVLSGAFVQGILGLGANLRTELSGRFDHWGNNDGIALVQASPGASIGRTPYANRSKDAFSPRIGLRYQVLKTLSVHTAFYKAFRAPNLAELYRRFNSGSTQSLPNPDLDPEYATGYEAGFDFQPSPWLQLKATAYNADMDNLNTFVTISTSPAQRKRENIQKTRSDGGEAYLALRPIAPLFFSVSMNYDNDRIVSNGTSTSGIGSRVGRVPLQKETAKVTYTTREIGELSLIARHEGVGTTLQGIPLAPFTVEDFQARREIKYGTSVFVSVENIANTQYQVALTAISNGVASLGLPRTIRVGVDMSRF